MTNSLKRFGGVLSVVALLVVLAWTPGEAGLGGVQRMVSAPSAVEDTGDTSLPWYFSMLQPVLTLSLTW